VFLPPNVLIHFTPNRKPEKKSQTKLG